MRLVNFNAARFERICRVRGRALEAVRACVVSRDGTSLTADVKHDDYRPRDLDRNALVYNPDGTRSELQPDGLRLTYGCAPSSSSSGSSSSESSSSLQTVGRLHLRDAR